MTNFLFQTRVVEQVALYTLSSLFANLCNFIVSDDGLEKTPKYYRYNRVLLLTRVLILQDVFLRNIFYFVFY